MKGRLSPVDLMRLPLRHSVLVFLAAVMLLTSGCVSIYERAYTVDTVDGWREFLKESEGDGWEKERRNAKARIAYIAFERALSIDTEDAYRDFVAKFGVYSLEKKKDAERRIAYIQAVAEDTVKTYYAFLREHPPAHTTSSPA